MPLFSVIIPSYNRADLIGAAIDSVLAQSLPDMEVIVVDDGSTDATLSVLAGYGDKIRVLEQPNGGPGAARSRGLRAAVGEYAAFLDSDDLWFPWTAELYRRAIERHHRPVFVAGKPFVFESTADIQRVKPAGLITAEFPDYYASGDEWRWYSASSFVIRRDAALAVGAFDAGWGVAEDADLAMKLGVSHGFVQVQSPPTFAYRSHGGNIMKNPGRIFVGTSLLIDHEKGGRYPGGVLRQRERRVIICRQSRWCALDCLARGESQMAWDIFLRTAGWQLRLGRWKFLAGFPIRAIGRKPGPSHS